MGKAPACGIHPPRFIHLGRDLAEIVLQHQGREGDADRNMKQQQPEVRINQPQRLATVEQRDQVHLEREHGPREGDP